MSYELYRCKYCGRATAVKPGEEMKCQHCGGRLETEPIIFDVITT
jgi:DNA-directed RNA polymerase subunit RPC12/RpoP